MLRPVGTLFVAIGLSLASAALHAEQTKKVRPSPARATKATVSNTDLKPFLENQCFLEMPLKFANVGDDEQSCTDDAPCESNVYVNPIGATECEASWEHKRVRVEYKQSPQMVWKLVDQSGHPERMYHFASIDKDDIDGIAMCPGSYIRERFDVRNGDCTDASCLGYQWTAVNKRPRKRDDKHAPYDGIRHGGTAAAAIHFGIIVVDKDGKACNFNDPIIITSGS